MFTFSAFILVLGVFLSEKLHIMVGMKDNNQSLGDMNLVPERDELRSHQTKRRRSSTPTAGQKVEAKSSGWVSFLLTILVLAMFATGAAGYFFYIQGQAALEELQQADNRLVLLENRLSMVGEAAEQTSMGFLERVDFNFSEIDKLWAARRANNTDVETNAASLASQSASLSSVESALSTQTGRVNQNSAQLANIDSTVAELDVDGLGRQLTTLNNDLDQVKTLVSSLESSLAGRVATTEEDIESINVYRLQLNQRLNTIQNSISNLQQQTSSQ